MIILGANYSRSSSFSQVLFKCPLFKPQLRYLTAEEFFDFTIVNGVHHFISQILPSLNLTINIRIKFQLQLGKVNIKHQIV